LNRRTGVKKSQEVLGYYSKNPEATVMQVAKATGVSYSYTYKLLNKKIVSKVNRPTKKIVSDGSTADYYELPKDAKELQDLISYKNMNAQIGECFRECYRYGEAPHSDMLRGAKKIKFYAEAEIARLEKLGG
jgi:hypothetical protein